MLVPLRSALLSVWPCLFVTALAGCSDGFDTSLLSSPQQGSKPQQEAATEKQEAPRPDLVSRFLGEPVPMTLAEFQRLGLVTGQADVHPWSDDYWPVLKGGLGFRYSDPSFPNSSYWPRMHDYVVKFPASRLISQGSDRIAQLSPAEKYDLLVGDTSFSLTAEMWAQGKERLEEKGDIPEWLGFCQGWSSAAIHFPRPAQKISVLAADGVTKVPFYPADIKALASLLWARAPGKRINLGKRCTELKPEKDYSGRILDPECFDVRPEDWHRTIAWRVGKNKQSLIMDLGNNREVWNYPIVSYSYEYVNVEDGEIKDSLEAARVPLKKFYDDRFKRFRSPKAESVVGIRMVTKYVSTIDPAPNETDGPENDDVLEAVLQYDLELDHDGRILKGEWYGSERPDIIWFPAKRARAFSVGDYDVEDERKLGHEWVKDSALPAGWRQAALKASQNGQVLAAVVEKLVQWSQKSPE